MMNYEPVEKIDNKTGGFFCVKFTGIIGLD
jgi:hypothetical protein